VVTKSAPVTDLISLFIDYSGWDLMPKQSVDDDTALVNSWQKGDLASFETLVRRHQRRVVNVAYRITGDYDEACEVAQDAFVAAYRGISSYRSTTRFPTWLMAITVSMSRNRLQQLHAKRQNEAYSPGVTANGETLDRSHELSVAAPSTLERLERHDIHEKIQECIRSLSDDHREVLVLRDMLDFPCHDVCEILDVLEGTVKSRLFRAREMVKDCLKLAMGEL
jgi:RNA polymerase sigma-70 factor (ECF subfamily)